MDKKISNKTSTLDSNINSKKNRKLNWQDISIKDRCNMAEELTSIYIAFKNIALGLDGHNLSNQYSVGAPVKGMDVITTMIKIKIFSRTDLDTPWITLNQIINHIRQKGGMYSDVSRDTINRRINRLVKKDEISKIIVSDLKESEIKKIVHHRSFKYVYSTSERVKKALRKGELTASQVAPLDTFLVHMKNFINLLPNDERVKVINHLISNENIL